MKAKTPILALLALAFAFGSGFVTRGLTTSERIAVIKDLRTFAEGSHMWAEFYGRTPQEFSWYYGIGDGYERAASYLENYETSGIRLPASNALREQ